MAVPKKKKYAIGGGFPQTKNNRELMRTSTNITGVQNTTNVNFVFKRPLALHKTTGLSFLVAHQLLNNRFQTCHHLSILDEKTKNNEPHQLMSYTNNYQKLNLADLFGPAQTALSLQMQHSLPNTLFKKKNPLLTFYTFADPLATLETQSHETPDFSAKTQIKRNQKLLLTSVLLKNLNKLNQFQAAMLSLFDRSLLQNNKFYAAYSFLIKALINRSFLGNNFKNSFSAFQLNSAFLPKYATSIHEHARRSLINQTQNNSAFYLLDNTNFYFDISSANAALFNQIYELDRVAYLDFITAKLAYMYDTSITGSSLYALFLTKSSMSNNRLAFKYNNTNFFFYDIVSKKQINWFSCVDIGIEPQYLVFAQQSLLYKQPLSMKSNIETCTVLQHVITPKFKKVDLIHVHLIKKIEVLSRIFVLDRADMITHKKYLEAVKHQVDLISPLLSPRSESSQIQLTRDVWNSAFSLNSKKSGYRVRKHLQLNATQSSHTLNLYSRFTVEYKGEHYWASPCDEHVFLKKSFKFKLKKAIRFIRFMRIAKSTPKLKVKQVPSRFSFSAIWKRISKCKY